MTDDPPDRVNGSPFHSFWMGGFEGADHRNRFGTPLDMACASGHLEHLDADYAGAAERGLGGVRESVGWRISEPAPSRHDFGRVQTMARAGRRHGLQIVWTLMHYGTPADVDLHDDRFIDRFAAFAAAAARAIGPLSEAPPVYNPINEIGFLAWAVAETSRIHPYRPDLRAGARYLQDGNSLASGYAVKRRLVAGVLAAIDAIRQVDARARFLHVEPVVHVVAPTGQPELAELAQAVRDYQWHAWDLIAGREAPELGGSMAALDCVGINHYHDGQWEVVTEKRLSWHERDPRRRSLSALLGDVWQRYGRPMMIAETGHFGSGRAQWIDEAAAQVALAREAGVPVEALCLYPLVDRPDWDDPAHWHHSGLWDMHAAPASRARTLAADYAAAIARWQGSLPVADAITAQPRLLPNRSRNRSPRRSRASSSRRRTGCRRIGARCARPTRSVRCCNARRR